MSSKGKNDLSVKTIGVKQIPIGKSFAPIHIIPEFYLIENH